MLNLLSAGTDRIPKHVFLLRHHRSHLQRTFNASFGRRRCPKAPLGERQCAGGRERQGPLPEGALARRQATPAGGPAEGAGLLRGSAPRGCAGAGDPGSRDSGTSEWSGEEGRAAERLGGTAHPRRKNPESAGVEIPGRETWTPSVWGRSAPYTTRIRSGRSPGLPDPRFADGALGVPSR